MPLGLLHRLLLVASVQCWVDQFLQICFFALLHNILKTCCQAEDWNRPCADWKRLCGKPHTTWIHHICQDTGVTASEALELAEDRWFWRNGSGLWLNATRSTTTIPQHRPSTLLFLLSILPNTDIFRFQYVDIWHVCPKRCNFRLPFATDCVSDRIYHGVHWWMVQTKEDGLTENGQMTLSSGVGQPCRS